MVFEPTYRGFGVHGVIYNICAKQTTENTFNITFNTVTFIPRCYFLQFSNQDVSRVSTLLQWRIYHIQWYSFIETSFSVNTMPSLFTNVHLWCVAGLVYYPGCMYRSLKAKYINVTWVCIQYARLKKTSRNINHLSTVFGYLHVYKLYLREKTNAI